VHVLAVNAVVENLSRTAKMNDVDPQAWLADMLARINDHNIQNSDQLLPWNWKAALASQARCLNAPFEAWAADPHAALTGPHRSSPVLTGGLPIRKPKG
jgi:IS66 C-terminal element